MNHLETICRLHKIVYQFNQLASKTLKQETPLTFSQFLVLALIYTNSETDENGTIEACNLTQKEMSTILGESESALSKQIDNLSKKGYVHQEENELNRREKKLKLTSHGLEEIQSASRSANLALTSLFGCLTQNESNQFEKHLKKIAQNLDEE